MTSSVCCTPVPPSALKLVISLLAIGEPIIAPPPKPMMAMPVAMPRLSGNHLISVETGEM